MSRAAEGPRESRPSRKTRTSRASAPSRFRLSFVTSNAGKAEEASRFLGREVEALPLDLPEIQSLDFEEVVRRKAMDAARVLGRAVLVEDSGLSLPAWGGFPGPLTRWVTQETIGPAGLARLAHAWGDARAIAVSTLAVAEPGAAAAELLVVAGRVPGRLAPEPRGSGGFGWDVIFIPEGETRTFAEMSDAEKDARSHRGRAFAALREALARR